MLVPEAVQKIVALHRAKLNPFAPLLGLNAQSIVNPPRVVDVDQQVGARVLLPQARQPYPLLPDNPYP